MASAKVAKIKKQTSNPSIKKGLDSQTDESTRKLSDYEILSTIGMSYFYLSFVNIMSLKCATHKKKGKKERKIHVKCRDQQDISYLESFGTLIFWMFHTYSSKSFSYFS